ncbi:MAG: DUF4395 domain-containing protein [Chloroflexota bacterium]
MSANSANFELPRIDLNALRVNQALIITLLIVAFVLNAVWLVLLVGIVMAAGTALGVPGFKPVYQYVLKPLNLVKPEIERDNPEPHRFAQGLGAAFTLAGAIALFLNAVTLGWGLSWLVVALAAINLFGGFCAGCFVYYWLNRLNVPGFVKAPPPNTIPGMRPRGSN